MSVGTGIFLFSVAGVYRWGEMIDISSIALVFAGLAIIMFGLAVFWRQDISFDGAYEPKATGTPFRGIDIRKVSVWIFLMSEMMVFTSLFSTYMRYRFGIESCESVFESGQWVEGTSVTCFEP
ncbi:MAG TPA: hypothetical protein D7H74_01760, partial [Candidatus Poseidoniales archaeon]